MLSSSNNNTVADGSIATIISGAPPDVMGMAAIILSAVPVGLGMVVELQGPRHGLPANPTKRMRVGTGARRLRTGEWFCRKRGCRVRPRIRRQTHVDGL